MAVPKVHSGARAILKIDNQVVVYATNVSYNITTEFKEIQGIDNSLPDELVPTTIKVEVTCTNFRVPKESASALGLQPTILNHLHQRYINIEIRDRGTNDVILYVPKAMLTGRDGQIGAKSLATETWRLVGIGYWDERTPERPALATGNQNVVGQVANLAKKITNIF